MKGGAAVGWLEWPSEPSVDAGVPVAVRQALSRALTQVGLVTFIVTEPHLSMTVASVRQGFVAKLLRPTLVQGTTNNPAAVEMLFDDPLQAWWLGTAAAVISASGDVAPALDAGTWRALVGDEWTTRAHGLPGVDAVLRAGVDGEMAGWWSRDEAFRERFAASLCGRIARVVDDG